MCKSSRNRSSFSSVPFHMYPSNQFKLHTTNSNQRPKETDRVKYLHMKNNYAENKLALFDMAKPERNNTHIMLFMCFWLIALKFERKCVLDYTDIRYDDIQYENDLINFEHLFIENGIMVKLNIVRLIELH